MAHFAELDENNVVLRVLVVNNSDIIDANGEESEEIGINFLTELFGGHRWVQTSYNSSFRKNYASEGYIYDEQRDAFISPSPHSGWLLDEETCRWVSPIPMPDAGFWKWDDETESWVEIVIEP